MKIEDYYKKAKELKNNLKLVILGKDPYPSERNGIAFCKDSFSKMNKSCSGRYVIESIMEEDFDDIKDMYNEKTPIDLFTDLLDKGVLFLNLSNKLLTDSDEINKNLTETLAENKQYLPKAGNFTFIKCGKFREKFFRENYLIYSEKHEIVIHPDVRNKYQRTERWDSYWKKGVLKKLYLD